jgi:hypothetical protein
MENLTGKPSGKYDGHAPVRYDLASDLFGVRSVKKDSSVANRDIYSRIARRSVMISEDPERWETVLRDIAQKCEITEKDLVR